MLNIDTVDEFTKLLLIFGITFAIVGISIQFMRVLGQFSGILEDLRISIKNIGNVTTQLAEDYKLLSGAIRGLSSTLKNFNKSVLKPLGRISEIFSKFLNRHNKDEDEGEKENND